MRSTDQDKYYEAREKLWREFLSESSQYEIVWVGEIHGVSQNYHACKDLVTKLLPLGFNTIALELPRDLENAPPEALEAKLSQLKDGRGSKDTLKFLSWLKKTVLKVIFFHPGDQNFSDPATYEQALADELIQKLGKSKTVVISGDLHSQLNFCSGLVTKETGKKILRVGLKYSGGKFYNFGVSLITSNLSEYDEFGWPFGTITKNTHPATSDSWCFYVGEATPVTLLK